MSLDLDRSLWLEWPHHRLDLTICHQRIFHLNILPRVLQLLPYTNLKNDFVLPKMIYIMFFPIHYFIIDYEAHQKTCILSANQIEISFFQKKCAKNKKEKKISKTIF